MKPARYFFALSCLFALTATAQITDIDRARCGDLGLPSGTVGYAKCLREPDVEELRRQCWAAMASKTTPSGQMDFGATAQCRDDPVAHLRPSKPKLDCTPSRDAFGRIDSLICQ